MNKLTFSGVLFSFFMLTQSVYAADKDNDATMAWIMSQKFVEERLLSPGSADYGSIWKGTAQDSRIAVTTLEEDKYKVCGWVDSQNSSAVMVRTYFKVLINYMGNDKWRLENIVMTPFRKELTSVCIFQ